MVSDSREHMSRRPEDDPTVRADTKKRRTSTRLQHEAMASRSFTYAAAHARLHLCTDTFADCLLSLSLSVPPRTFVRGAASRLSCTGTIFRAVVLWHWTCCRPSS